MRVASLDPKQLRFKVSKPFTALVFDCEGASPSIVEDFPKTIDNLCRLMVVVSADDMTPDTYPHGARETTTAELSDTPYTP